MTKFKMGGEHLRVIYTQGAVVCEHCEEWGKYEEYRTGIPFLVGDEVFELVVHKSWEDCETMYATLEHDDGGGVGNYLIIVHETGEPKDASYPDDFKCAGQRRLEGEDI